MKNTHRYYFRNEKKNQSFAGFISIALLMFFWVVTYRLIYIIGVIQATGAFFVCLSFVSYVFMQMTKKYRNRRKILSTPVPANWRSVLSVKVRFYRDLSEEDRIVFEKEIQLFLAEKHIVGIGVELTEKDKLLVAASAIIPIFRFSEWEYTNVKEILVYPNAFDENFETTGNKRNILGMVGTGLYRDVMLLSLADLKAGFAFAEDRKNVGIHEFAHLIDLADGVADGVPEVLLDNAYVMPWLKLIRKEIENIRKGKSDINPYGATNETEFFAVLSEYFFENPKRLARKHPEIYDMLERIFNYDMQNFFSDSFHRMKIGRNDLCPCGSGLKYKHCCGKK